MKLNTQQALRIPFDNIGIFVSFLCIIHCMLLPIIISFLPLVGLSLLENELAHKLLIYAALGIAILSFVPGYRIHKRKLVLLIASIGLLFMLVAVLYAGEAWGELAENSLVFIGGCILIVGHIYNKTFCRNCLKCDQNHEEECGILK